ERRSQQLAECLLRQSQLERRLLVQLEQVKQEKLIMIANRMERQKEYEARREAEFQAAMDLERERGLQKKREEAGILAVLREIWANHKIRKREAAYKRHYDFVERDVVLLLIGFAIKLAEFRMYTR
ncbi:unnamed protein product, partial [Dicrocoelium dendriticum]